ncbi:DinB family protein [uncultured Agrococcus sp.]|uniref:DinB family protein n=1 Tax=uncultured Agrococcus sp. TaxID=382258 RepID=UPI0025EE0510|nr:DinB family protein [uncultured Agrococcus sp.]
MHNDAKAMLLSYLQENRDAVLWKLEGLSERELRLPHTETGTNLLGLVKHLAGIEFGYFGDCFGRPGPDLPWMHDDAEENADMFATADEPATWIVDLYRQAWAHADATIDALALDALGTVPWWHHARREVTLHRILVHVATETARHAGHADIIRERIDGEVGLRSGNTNMPAAQQAWWRDYNARLTAIALTFEDAGAAVRSRP